MSTNLPGRLVGCWHFYKGLCRTRISLTKGKEKNLSEWTGQNPERLSSGREERMKGESSLALPWRGSKVSTVMCTVGRGSGIPAHPNSTKGWHPKMDCPRVWQSGEERKHLSVPIIQLNSNGKWTEHLLMTKGNIPRGEIEESSKEGIKQY